VEPTLSARITYVNAMTVMKDRRDLTTNALHGSVQKIVASLEPASGEAMISIANVNILMTSEEMSAKHT